MHDIVIYSVGSPVIVDIEESIFRAGLAVAAAVRNIPGEDYLFDKSCLIDPADLTPRILQLPYLVGLFTPGNRFSAVSQARRFGFVRAHALIDPSVPCPRHLEYEEGLYVNAGCTIGAASQLREFVFINRGASIGHHVRLDAFVSIGPGAVIGGMVHIGKGSVIGAGAVVLPELTVGSNAVVGAGSVVTKAVPDNCLVLGNPARIVKQGIPGYKGGAVP